MICVACNSQLSHAKWTKICCNRLPLESSPKVNWALQQISKGYLLVIEAPLSKLVKLGKNICTESGSDFLIRTLYNFANLVQNGPVSLWLHLFFIRKFLKCFKSLTGFPLHTLKSLHFLPHCRRLHWATSLNCERTALHVLISPLVPVQPPRDLQLSAPHPLCRSWDPRIRPLRCRTGDARYPTCCNRFYCEPFPSARFFVGLWATGSRSGSDSQFWCRSGFGSGFYPNFYICWKIRILLLLFTAVPVNIVFSF